MASSNAGPRKVSVNFFPRTGVDGTQHCIPDEPSSNPDLQQKFVRLLILHRIFVSIVPAMIWLPTTRSHYSNTHACNRSMLSMAATIISLQDHPVMFGLTVQVPRLCNDVPNLSSLALVSLSTGHRKLRKDPRQSSSWILTRLRRRLWKKWTYPSVPDLCKCCYKISRASIQRNLLKQKLPFGHPCQRPHQRSVDAPRADLHEFGKVV